MEATCSSETSVYFRRTTRRYIPEGRNLHNRRCENIISCITSQEILRRTEAWRWNYLLPVSILYRNRLIRRFLWVLCHHSMSRPHFSDGVDSVQIYWIISRGGTRRVVLQLESLAGDANSPPQKKKQPDHCTLHTNFQLRRIRYLNQILPFSRLS
jgi:hypothetical protein